MTGIRGATTTSPFQDRSESVDRPLPDVLATLEAEYFVEWQVADLAPFAHDATSGESNSL